MVFGERQRLPIDRDEFSCTVDVAGLVRDAGFAVARSQEFHFSEQLKESLAQLTPTWEQLQPDSYLADGGHYRWRRYGKYSLDRSCEIVSISVSESYFQDRAVNPFSGGLHRYFSPLEDRVLRNDFLRALIAYGARQFSAVTQHVPIGWDVDVHQVRVVGTADHTGLPTPEGVHRDGLDFLSIHLIQRWNTVGGRTIVCNSDLVPLAQEELSSPLDSVYADDARVLHYTEPITPAGRDQAVRDVLLLGFHRVATHPALADNRILPATDVRDMDLGQVGI